MRQRADLQQLTQRAMLLEEDLSRQNDLHSQLRAEVSSLLSQYLPLQCAAVLQLANT